MVDLINSDKALGTLPPKTFREIALISYAYYCKNILAAQIVEWLYFSQLWKSQFLSQHHRYLDVNSSRYTLFDS